MQKNMYLNRQIKAGLSALQKIGYIPLLLLGGYLLMCAPVFAQSGDKRTVKGSVTTDGKAEAIPGASVVIKGSPIGTTTDTKGEFSLEATSGNTLVISFIGYETKEILVGNKTRIDVNLVENISNLQEVVVVGYGEMKRTDLSSSQITVSGKELNRTINTSFEQGLQGRAANVNVTQSSGQPGAAPTVIIRGLSTLTGSAQPLYVIDGVQIKPDNFKDDPSNRPTGFSNILSSINPDDIETVNILQGPSATAIFGATGANGVVMITTKRGKAGETKISFNTSLTMQAQPKYIEVMKLPDYARFRNEMERAGGTASDDAFLDPSVLGQGTNWQDELYKPTLMQKYSLGLSGGSEKSNYYFSGEYFDQEGVAPGSGFNRYSTRLNLENQTRKWLKIGTSLSIGFTREKVNTTNGDLVKLALEQNPSVPVKNPDGSWGGPASTQFQYTNPVMIASLYNDYNRRTSFLGGLYGDIKFLKNFTWHNEVNGSMEYFKYYSFHPGYQVGGFIVSQDNAVSNRQANTNIWWSYNSRVHYDNKFGKHSVSAMVAHEAQQWSNETLTATRKNFITNTVEELSGGDASSISNVSNNSGRSAGAKEAYLGRLVYIYNDRYIVQASYRADGYSGFGPENRWGYFPAASVAWKVSEEDFLRNVSQINNLKLRFEVGESGNSGNDGSAIYSPLQAVPTGWGTGFLSNRYPNPFLGWETTRTFNLGFDLNILNNRVEIIADAYLKNVRNLITKNVYPYTLGGDISFSPGYIDWPTANAGNMKNKGIGVTINTVNISKGDLNWKTGINLSVDRNKITNLPNTLNPSWNSTQVAFLSRAGGAASLITGYIADGIFQSADEIRNHAVQTSNRQLTVSPNGTWVGDVKFRDISGPDGVPDGIIDANDRTVIGNPWPKFTLGFNNTLSYKNFDLTAFITGSFGNDVINYPRYQMEIPGNTGTFGNYYVSVNNFARPSSYDAAAAETVTLLNPGHNIARISPGDPNGNNRMSTNFLEDGSYIRMKNLTLGYNFPKNLIRKMNISGLRTAVSVQNLFTITKYTGYDPEIGPINYGGTLMAGVDTGRYPSVRLYSFSLVADF